MRASRLTLCCAALAVCMPSTAGAAPEHAHAHQHGTIDFATSCTTEAHVHVQTGVALLHHMMYDQAEPEFAAAAERDPECAVAHWGIAMTQLRPLWAPPTSLEFEKGLAAAIRAAEIGAPTARERGFIAAVSAYFDDDAALDHQQRLRAWHDAQRTLHAAHPDDVDAGAFYALAQLATAPPDDREFRQQARAGALLEKLHAQAPEHPGVFHYLIHAYDNPKLAEQAREIAHGYDQLAPDVPHALHMPSHIFVRLGEWLGVIDWNARSAEAALRQPVGEYTSMHYAHALDYQIYAHLQRGQDADARAVLEQLAAADNYQPHDGTAYGLAAAHARYVLEREDWEAAARLPVREPSTFPWDDFPAHESISWFARGLGAARSGDTAGATEARDRLEQLLERTLAADAQYWAILVDARRVTVAAWLAYAEGDTAEALRLMVKAADREDSVDKHPITPSEVRPARELLGDMLVLAGEPQQAIDAYRAALAISPRRLNSVYGLARAAERAGDADLARQYFEQAAALLAENADRRLDGLDAYLAVH